MVSAIGSSCPDTWHSLLVGKSGIRQGDILSAPIQLWQDAKCALQPDQARVDRLLEMAVLEAIHSAQLSPEHFIDTGIVIGSSRGYQREWEQILSTSPALETWQNLLQGNLAINIARSIQSRGYCSVLSTACASGNWAIAKGYELIVNGTADLVLVGAVDSAITPLTKAGFQRLGVLAKTGVFPFSQEREGLAIGEGAGAMILASTDFQSRHNYGYILGWGITNDAFHITSASPSLDAAETAIAQCLTQAGLFPSSIDYINAHGTATLNNDQREARLIAKMFPHSPIVSSTKGATGHCLGATGLMEAIFCLLALKHQQVPPCTGLQTPAFDLNLPPTSFAHPMQRALNFSFGFGGQNTVVAMAGAAITDH